MTTVQQAGIVVIGRNEGQRLQRCLRSVSDAKLIIYVDSGSTDDSVRMARALGATVVELDLSIPFTAARARNAGLHRLTQIAPQLHYVQFVDGDCEIQPGWLEAAQQFLDTHSGFAVVAGRRRERYPEQSIFNQFCDQEWDTPIGDALACGGDAMMRMSALQEAGGYRDGLIAGEEPELCVRLRGRGWKVRRLDREMTLHDANIVYFRQWWKRTQRGGHAYAEGAWLHGNSPERHYVRETVRTLVWGLALPLIVLCLSLSVSRWWLLVVFLYPLQIFRMAWRGRGVILHPWYHAIYMTMGKFAEACGALQFYVKKILRIKSRLIEYK